MAITIRPVPDKDLPRNCEIEAAAYAAFPLPEQFRPAPPPPKTSSDYESSNASTTNSTSPYAARLKYLIDNRDSDPSINYIGAYDDTTSQLIAFAKWHVYDNDEAAKAARRPMRSFSNAICPEACDELFGGLYDLKEKTVGGKRHLCKPLLLYFARSSYGSLFSLLLYCWQKLEPMLMLVSSTYASHRPSLPGSWCGGHVAPMGREESG